MYSNRHTATNEKMGSFMSASAVFACEKSPLIPFHHTLRGGAKSIFLRKRRIALDCLF